MDVVAPSPDQAQPDESHAIQAEQLRRRWMRRAPGVAAPAAGDAVPGSVPLPGPVWRHYRHFAWVVHEQRLMLGLMAVTLAATGLIWSLALRLGHKPPVVVRAAPSLKEAAAAFYGAPEVSYDQVAFFLGGCLPLLYAADGEGHAMLALAQGIVAPDVYGEAERRLDGSRTEMEANGVSQNLGITAVTDLAADGPSGRIAAAVEGRLVVIVRGHEARFFPWRARVLLERNPGGRLNPYPFYLARLEQRTGPAAISWQPVRPAPQVP